MHLGYDYVEDEDGSASDISFASECILQPDSVGPVRGHMV